MSRSKDAWAPHPTLPLATREEMLAVRSQPDLLYFLDTETTGLSRSVDRVVEVAVAAVDRRTWTVLWEAAQLIDPTCSMPSAATRVNGITTAMVRGQPLFVDVWPRVAAKIPNGATVVAHAAAFDRGMIASELARTRYPAPEWAWEDSRALAKKVLPDRSHKLQDLRDLFRCPGGTAHRALGDVQTLVAVYRALLERQAEDAAAAAANVAPLLATRKVA